FRQRKPIAYQEVGGERRTIESGYRVLGPTRVGFELGDYDEELPLIIDPVLVYSTYLGGSGDDRIPVVAVDPAGAVYVAGHTTSVNFPSVNSAQPTSGGGQDLFAVKLNAAGTSLIYSTYIGGSGEET